MISDALKEKTNCCKCGKKIFYYEMQAGHVCYDCAHGKTKYETQSTKPTSNNSSSGSSTIGALFLKVILAIGFILFMLFFIGACIGNFMNVDESPAPGLHWKP